MKKEHNKIKNNITLTYPVDINKITEAKLNAGLEKGYEDMLNGNTISAEQAFAELHKEFNV